MAIKQIILPSTGIYQRKLKEVALRTDDPANLNDIFSSLEGLASSPSTNLEDPIALSQLEAEAVDFLKEYIESDMGGFTEKIRSEAALAGFDFVVSSYIDRVRPDLDLEFQRRLSEEEKRKLTERLIRLERASDAGEMVFCICVIRSQVTHGSNQVQYGSVGQVVSRSFMLGRAYERFGVRTSERNAWTGRKILRAVSKGGNAAKMGIDQRYQEIVAKFKASGKSERTFAETARVSRTTLRRALKQVDPNLSR